MGKAARKFTRRNDFAVFCPTPTRWNDNDQYGHINNAVYFLLFDTAVNGWLGRAIGQDIRSLPALGVVAETSCIYLRQSSFPDSLEVGMVVSRLGRSSVTYELGVFTKGNQDPHALGHFVHVYVDVQERRPTRVPDVVVEAVRNLL